MECFAGEMRGKSETGTRGISVLGKQNLGSWRSGGYYSAVKSRMSGSRRSGGVVWKAMRGQWCLEFHVWKYYILTMHLTSFFIECVVSHPSLEDFGNKDGDCLNLFQSFPLTNGALMEFAKVDVGFGHEVIDWLSEHPHSRAVSQQLYKDCFPLLIPLFIPHSIDFRKYAGVQGTYWVQPSFGEW